MQIDELTQRLEFVSGESAKLREELASALSDAARIAQKIVGFEELQAE